MFYNVNSILFRGYIPGVAESIGKILVENFKTKKEIVIGGILADTGVKIDITPAIFMQNQKLVSRKQIYIYTESHANKYLVDFAVGAIMRANYPTVGLDVYAVYYSRHKYVVISQFNSEI